jgi:hypothetical protein
MSRRDRLRGGSKNSVDPLCTRLPISPPKMPNIPGGRTSLRATCVLSPTEMSRAVALSRRMRVGPPRFLHFFEAVLQYSLTAAPRRGALDIGSKNGT